MTNLFDTFYKSYAKLWYIKKDCFPIISMYGKWDILIIVIGSDEIN